MQPLSVIPARLPAGIKQAPQLLSSAALPRTIPLCVHKVPAGFPSPASDYLEDGLTLDAYLVRHPASSFFFSVAGDCMTGAGIFDGDKVLIDRAIEPKHGHIVVAVLNNEFTLKRLYRRDGVLELRPENPAYQPIRLREAEELQVWGVVTAVVRKLKV
jgi:DNA polymerase V